MRGIEAAFMIAWAAFGLRFEKIQETQDTLLFYVSVPERSYRNNASGEEMSGMTLAKRFKETMIEIGIKRLVVKARIRECETWTEEMSRCAATEMENFVVQEDWHG